MVKGITTVHAIASEAAWQRLRSLFDELGFEPGRGWDDGSGRGTSHLAPVGNIEFVTGRMPAVPPLLVEVTSLDVVHAVVKRWLAGWARTEEMPELLRDIEPTHWGSRMFTVDLGTGAGDAELMRVAFWEREDVLQGRPLALEGDLSAQGMRFAIVVARWNAVITDRLLQGALDGILRSGGRKADIEIVRVPGAWEIPGASRMLADLRDGSGQRKFDAVITLGCLLRGETAHYEAIYNEAARGIGQSQQETGVPHAFGVLTCETLEQALNRAGVKAGNKGFEAAVAAIEMVSIARKLGHAEAHEHPGSGTAAAAEADAIVEQAGA